MRSNTGDVKIYMPGQSSEVSEIQVDNYEKLSVYTNREARVMKRNDYLKQYFERGFSIIPLKKNESPLIKWAEYRKESHLKSFPYIYG